MGLARNTDVVHGRPASYRRYVPMTCYRCSAHISSKSEEMFRTLRYAIHQALRGARRSRQQLNVLDINGGSDWFCPKFRMHSCAARDQVACTAAAKGWEAFESPMPKFFANAVKESVNRLVIDVGANTGFYTLLALAVDGKSVVTAYEPMTAVREILTSNLDINSMRKRVTVLPYAVSNISGSRALYVPDQSHGLIETSASLVRDFKGDTGESYDVKTVRLDSQHADSLSVGVIKVDAESHDLEVLRGAEQMLTRDRPTVFLEVLCGADEIGLTEILQRCRYVDFVLRPDGIIKPANEVLHDTEAWNHMWLPAERVAKIALLRETAMHIATDAGKRALH